MNNEDPFCISIALRGRGEMAPATPRVQGWSYHHVQPVWVFYIAASILLRVATTQNCWNTTRAVCIDALKRMCHYETNRQRIELFINRTDWGPGGADDSQCAPFAKLCGSPGFGGFPGPDPLQRSDDPHHLEEPQRPRSADPVWWDSVKSIGPLTMEAMGLRSPPTARSVLSKTQPMFAWHTHAYRIVAALHGADAAGAPRHHHADWCLTSGEIWTYVPGAKTSGRAEDRDPIRLLRSGERRTFIDTKDTPLPSLVARGARILTKQGQFYERAIQRARNL